MQAVANGVHMPSAGAQVTQLPTGKRGRKAKTRAKTKTKGKTARTKSKGARTAKAKTKTKGVRRTKGVARKQRTAAPRAQLDPRHENMLRDWGNVHEHLSGIVPPLQNFAGTYIDKLGAGIALSKVQAAVTAGLALRDAINAADAAIRIPA